MPFKTTALFIYLMFCLLLIGCTEVTENKLTPTKIEKKEVQNSSKTTNNKKVLKNEKNTDIGIIHSIDSKNISIAGKKNGEISIIYNVEKIEEDKISKLKSGQKVKIYNTGSIFFSDPAQGIAVDIELLKQ